MQDRTKIDLLSIYAGFATGAIIGGSYLIAQFVKQYEADKKKKILASMAISKFVEYSDVEVCQKVVQEMEFDLVTAGLTFKRSGKLEGQ